MNKLNQWLLAFFWAGLAGSSLLAQTSNGLVRFPSGNAAWIVDMTYPDESVGASGANPPTLGSAAQPRPKRVEVTRVKPLERFRITWSDKATSEIWIVKNNTLIEDPVSHFVDLESGFKLPSYLGRLDESLFAWIHANTPAQNTELAGEKCFLYEIEAGSPSAEISSESEDTESLTKRQAWIDCTNFVPVAYKNGRSQDRFTFLAEPSDQLKLPPKFQVILDNYENTFPKPAPWFKPKTQ